MVGEKVKDILEQYLVPFKPKRLSLVLDCPSCHKEGNTWLRKSDGASICWSCKQTWDAVGLVSILVRISRDQARSLIHGTEAGERVATVNPFAHIHFELGEEELDDADEIEIKPIKVDYLHPAANNSVVVAYLAKRGISPDLAVKLDIKAHSFVDGPFFMQKNFDGQYYGYQYRKANPEPGTPKTITLPGFKKDQFLLFMDLALVEGPAVVLVEGPFDAAKCWAAGIPAVAAYGKGISETQFRLLEESPVAKVYVGLDPDAHVEAAQVIDRLSRSKEVFRLLPVEGREDLGDCTSDEIKRAFEFAPPCSGAKTDRMEVYLKI